MNKPGHKSTEIGELPEDWDLLPMTKLAKYINGMAFKPSDWKDQGLPIVRIENLNNVEASFNYFNGQVDEKFLLKDNDILLSWSASLGVYIWNRGPAVLNQHIFKVIPKDGVDKFYLFWSLHRAIDDLSKFTHGSTMKHFQKGELERTAVALPPLPEQQKIAEILSTADKKIELIDREIIATEKLRKGLMQTLLTRGIGHTKFKRTEFGVIPAEWDVGTLEAFCERITDGSHYSPPEFKEGSRVIATVANMGRNKIIIDDCKRISNTDFALLVKNGCKPEKGDVLFSKDGTVGICFPYSQADDVVLLSSIAILKPNKKLHPTFVSYYLTSEKGVNEVTGLKTGSALKRVTLQNLKLVKIPHPSIDEQLKIAEILSTADKKIELLLKKKVESEKLKKGLMGALLTGQLRVITENVQGDA